MVFFICSLIIRWAATSMNCWSFQFPVVKTVEEHFSQVIHSLPLCLLQATKLIHNKISDSLFRKDITTAVNWNLAYDITISQFLS